MVQTSISSDRVERVTGTRLGIGTAVNHVRQTRQHNGAGTHGAWLQGDVQDTIIQAPGAERLGCLRDGDHLGVGGRIVQLFALIVTLSDDALLQGDYDGADGHLVFGGSAIGFGKGQFHVMDMKGVPWIGQR
jgi:hypothetical protein